MEKVFISSAYIYPICPLNINHAKMFIIGDIIARYWRQKGKEVFFPIALHYSGNTAHRISEIFNNLYSKTGKKTKENKSILNLYKNFYNTPTLVLKSFSDPINILDFYTKETLWELKSLDVSGNYDSWYTTKDKDFSAFVQIIISLYKKKGLIVLNKKGELALDYNNEKWKQQVKDLIERAKFTQAFHKNNMTAVIKNKNLKNDWGFLRKDGFGVIYNKKFVIDPMFDSELFTIFDLYAKFKRSLGKKIHNSKQVFKDIFEVLQGKRDPKNKLEENIVNWLPCDIFICEEHLKNWVVKKMYAESVLLDKKFQTANYFVLGMGLLNGKRMSASRGNAILASDLINNYGPTKARLIILMQGGHPSKTYNYSAENIKDINKMLSNFVNYYIYLITIAESGRKQKGERVPYQEICESLDKLIETGYYRQAIIELLSLLPKRFGVITSSNMARELMKIYTTYLNILLPSLLQIFADSKPLKMGKK